MPVRLEASAGLSEATGLLSWRRNPQPLQMHGELMGMFLISICLVGANTKKPRESAGSEWVCKGRAQFRLLMPSRACGIFSKCTMAGGLNQFSGGLQCATCARHEVWGWPNLWAMHGELATAKAGGDGKPQHLELAWKKVSLYYQLFGLKSCVLWTGHVKGWCFQPHSLLQ